jgi:hypothetical protein
MSTHLYGIREPDEKWRQMKKIWDACNIANVSVPREVYEYFNDDDPDDAGVIIEIDYHESKVVTSMHYEVRVDQIPDGVTILRFVNSW